MTYSQERLDLAGVIDDAKMAGDEDKARRLERVKLMFDSLAQRVVELESDLETLRADLTEARAALPLAGWTLREVNKDGVSRNFGPDVEAAAAWVKATFRRLGGTVEGG